MNESEVLALLGAAWKERASALDYKPRTAKHDKAQTEFAVGAANLAGILGQEKLKNIIAQRIMFGLDPFKD